MDYGRLIFCLAIAAMGVISLYLGKIEVATACLGVMGGVLTPHVANVKEVQSAKVSTDSSVVES